MNPIQNLSSCFSVYSHYYYYYYYHHHHHHRRRRRRRHSRRCHHMSLITLCVLGYFPYYQVTTTRPVASLEHNSVAKEWGVKDTIV
jgi:hypothetical protein